MNKRKNFAGCIFLLLLCTCLRCTSEPAPTIGTHSQIDTIVSTSSAQPPVTQTATSISGPYSQHTPQSKSITATTMPSATSEPTKARPTTVSLATAKLITNSTFAESNFTSDLFRRLPNGVESQIYVLTTTSLPLSDEHTLQKLWRYTLENNSYELIASWAAISEERLTSSIPLEIQPTIVAGLPEGQDDASSLTEQREFLMIKLSPDGRHLAIGMHIFACCPEDNLSLPIKTEVFALDLETNQITQVWTAWGERLGIVDLLWSPDGSKLALQILYPGYVSIPYVYNFPLSQLEQIGRGQEVVWCSDSNRLILKALERPSNGFYLSAFDIKDQQEETLKLTSAKNAIGSARGEVWVIHAVNPVDIQLSRLNVDTVELHPIAQLNGSHMVTPKGNFSGSLIAYERWLGSGDRLFQILDLREKEIYTALNSAVYTWEWSNFTDVILARFSHDESGQAQYGLIHVEDRVVIILPQPPDMNEYESVTSVTW